MTDADLQQAQKLAQLRDEYARLASRIENNGLFLLDKVELGKVLAPLTSSEMDKVKEILVNRMKEEAKGYADALARM